MTNQSRSEIQWAVAGAVTVLGLVGLVWITLSRCPHPNSIAPPALALQSSTPRQPEPSPEEPENVLVWIESTPPGAAIVRVSDGFVLGWTPETIQFRRSSEPVSVRIEAKGFVAATRSVPTKSDGQVTVELVPTSK